MCQPIPGSLSFTPSHISSSLLHISSQSATHLSLNPTHHSLSLNPTHLSLSHVVHSDSEVEGQILNVPLVVLERKQVPAERKKKAHLEHNATPLLCTATPLCIQRTCTDHGPRRPDDESQQSHAHQQLAWPRRRWRMEGRQVDPRTMPCPVVYRGTDSVDQHRH